MAGLQKVWDGTAWVPPSVVDLSAYARKDQVPSLEETLAVAALQWNGQADNMDLTVAGTSAGGRGCVLLTAPVPLIVLSVDVVVNATIPASGTNYWTLMLRRHTDVGNRTDITSKALTAGTTAAWENISFSTQAWDDNARLLAAGQSLALWGFITGTPTQDLAGPSTATVRYARQ